MRAGAWGGYGVPRPFRGRRRPPAGATERREQLADVYVEIQSAVAA